jgi:formamidopyrimidine-DNA glycosylase
MPELPEVQTVVNDLNKVLTNKIIIEIKALDKKILAPSVIALTKQIIGQRLKGVRRRGKMIIIAGNKHFLVFHLKMTGQLIFRSSKKIIAGGHPITSTGLNVPNKFTRLIFKFNDDSFLYFNDIRKFGWVKIVNRKDLSDIESAIGQEPLAKSFTLDIFNKLLIRRPKMLIKAFLLDQKLVTGLGNIYVDEVLFKAGVRPIRRVKTLTKLEKIKIFKAIPFILQKAILKRGTTFSNYLDGHGAKGGFVPFLQVYGRANKPCKVCGQLIKKTRVAGRGTHWCSYCQK